MGCVSSSDGSSAKAEENPEDSGKTGSSPEETSPRDSEVKRMVVKEKNTQRRRLSVTPAQVCVLACESMCASDAHHFCVH